MNRAVDAMATSMDSLVADVVPYPYEFLVSKEAAQQDNLSPRQGQEIRCIQCKTVTWLVPSHPKDLAEESGGDLEDQPERQSCMRSPAGHRVWDGGARHRSYSLMAGHACIGPTNIESSSWSCSSLSAEPT